MLTAADIGDGVIRYSEARKTTHSAFREAITDKSRPQAGDVLLTKDGTLGRVALADGTECCINQSVALLRPSKANADGSLAMILRVRAYREALVFNSGGTTIKHLYISRVVKQRIAWPEPGIRARLMKLATEIETESAQLASNLARRIQLLEEKKRALITAAVMAQLDVTTASGRSVA